MPTQDRETRAASGKREVHMRMKCAVVLVVSLSFLASAVALGQGAPREPSKKRVPIPMLKDALERLEKLEGNLGQEKKLAGKQLDAARLEVKEIKLQIREFLADVENRKTMLPAYDCCPCGKGGRGEEAGKVEVNVHIDGGKVEAPEDAEPAEPAIEAVNETTFQSLLGALKEQGFADDRLSVFKQAASSQHYTVAQVKQILAQFSFPDDKLAALRLAKDRITDTENAFQIYGAFVHSSDKDEARKILEGVE